MSVPDTPSTAPVSPESSTRGRRSSRNTFRPSASAALVGTRPALRDVASHIRAGVKVNAPTPADTTSATTSNAPSMSSAPAFPRRA